MRATRRALPLTLALTSCGTAVSRGPGTTQGGEIRSLWVLFFWVAVAIAAVVSALILWSAIRYRKRSEELPPQFRVNVPLEIVYTLIPIAIVATLFVFTYRSEIAVERLDRNPAAVIHVRAFQWSWGFEYEGQGVSLFGTPEDPPELVVPVGEPVRIRLTADDVIHSFYISDFLFKRDAIPGHPTTFDLTVDRPGVYGGQCAEFCGLDHARMRFTVRAVEPAAFESWLAAQRAAP